jgi:hypothetical protein
VADSRPWCERQSKVARLFRALAIVALGSGCSDRIPSPSAPAASKHGEGTLVYWNNALEFIPDAAQTMFATSVTGLTSIEVFHQSSNGFIVSGIDAPSGSTVYCSPASPFAIAWADLDRDGESDIVVFDACGSWDALHRRDGRFEPQVLSALLPGFETSYFLTSATFGNPTRDILLSGADNALVVVQGSSGGWQTPVNIGLPQPFLGLQVTDLFLTPSSAISGPGATSLLVQGRRQFTSIDWSVNDDAAAAIHPISPIPTAPYLVGFDGFDQLSALPIDGCPAGALGLGTFANSVAEHVPWLKILFSTNTYTTSAIDASLDVDAYAIAPRKTDALVISLGSRDGAATTMSLWRVSGCDRNFELLSEAPAEFDWKTPSEMLAGTTNAIPKTRGVKLRARWLEEQHELLAVHYDGFDLRSFHGHLDGEQWVLVEEKQNIHAERTDLAFVN